MGRCKWLWSIAAQNFICGCASGRGPDLQNANLPNFLSVLNSGAFAILKERTYCCISATGGILWYCCTISQRPLDVVSVFCSITYTRTTTRVGQPRIPAAMDSIEPEQTPFAAVTAHTSKLQKVGSCLS